MKVRVEESIDGTLDLFNANDTYLGTLSYVPVGRKRTQSDADALNVTARDIARYASSAGGLANALQMMLNVALKVDDLEWARAVERTPNAWRPCDAAQDALTLFGKGK